MVTAACMLACEEFMKLVTCGSLSERSTSMSLPRLVTFAAMRMSLLPRPSSSRKASPWNDAVLPGRDHRARLRFGGIEHGLDRGFDDRPAHLGKQLLHAPLAEMRGADHGGEVAAEIMGVADIERDHVEDVVAQLACSRRA